VSLFGALGLSFGALGLTFGPRGTKNAAKAEPNHRSRCKFRP
jgi:hypothetical protein